MCYTSVLYQCVIPVCVGDIGEEGYTIQSNTNSPKVSTDCEITLFGYLCVMDIAFTLQDNNFTMISMNFPIIYDIIGDNISSLTMRIK